jgi:carbon monoxide dehydrogenase subunit G
MPRLEKSIVIAAPPDQVWSVASDYTQWHTWFVGLSAPKSVEGDGGLGTVIEHTVTVHNIPMPLKTTVVVCDPNARWRGEYTGPMTKGSQEWTYMATDGGTEVGLVMETELMGPAKLAEKMVINAFDRMTDQALVNLKARVEGS